MHFFAYFTRARQALFSSSTGQGALKAAITMHEVTRFSSGFNAPCPVPSVDLDEVFFALKVNDGGAFFAPPSTHTILLQARGAALNEAAVNSPRATQRARHEGSGPNDITTDYAVSVGMVIIAR